MCGWEFLRNQPVQAEIIILLPLYLHYGIFPPISQISNKGQALGFFSIFITPERWRWQFENSCLGLHLHTVALGYCYLTSSITLSFGRRWGGYRTPWLNQFYLIPRRYREYLSTYRWVSVEPWQMQGHWVSDTRPLPLSGTVREQTARHQDATEKSESSYKDPPFRRIRNTVGAIMCPMGSHFKRVRLRMLTPQITKEVTLSLSIAGIFT